MKFDFEHDLSTPYESIIDIGTVDDLIGKINNHGIKNQSGGYYPRTAVLLLAVLNKNPGLQLLEDWLIIMPYRLMWKDKKTLKDKLGLKWFEDLFTVVAVASPEAWERWSSEVVQKNNTTHDIYDRLYNYLLHLFGVIALLRQGFDTIVFPPQGHGVDIEAMCNGRAYAIECKFVKTSMKFESYYQRLESVYLLLNIKLPLSVSFFTLPSSICIKSLSLDQCRAVQKFVKLVSQNIEQSHCGQYGDLVFEYSPKISPQLVSIEKQKEFARQQAMIFLNGALAGIIEYASSKQLGNTKYSDHNKIIFIGIQWDEFFLIDWTRPAIEEVKLLLPLKTNNIEIMFSDDYDLPVDRYL